MAADDEAGLGALVNRGLERRAAPGPGPGLRFRADTLPYLNE